MPSVPPSAIHYWETGERQTCRLPVLTAIAAELGVSVEFLQVPPVRLREVPLECRRPGSERDAWERELVDWHGRANTVFVSFRVAGRRVRPEIRLDDWEAGSGRGWPKGSVRGLLPFPAGDPLEPLNLLLNLWGDLEGWRRLLLQAPADEEGGQVQALESRLQNLARQGRETQTEAELARIEGEFHATAAQLGRLREAMRAEDAERGARLLEQRIRFLDHMAAALEILLEPLQGSAKIEDRGLGELLAVMVPQYRLSAATGRSADLRAAGPSGSRLRSGSSS